jgi:hypothetical protein
MKPNKKINPAPTPFKYLFKDGHIESVFKRRTALGWDWEFFVPKTLDHPDLLIDFTTHKMVHKSCLKSTGANLYAIDKDAVKQRRKDNPRPRTIDYDDEWQESNLNGDFAYNGVTDDF